MYMRVYHVPCACVHAHVPCANICTCLCGACAQVSESRSGQHLSAASTMVDLFGELQPPALSVDVVTKARDEVLLQLLAIDSVLFVL